jgi:hypothetical protein
MNNNLYSITLENKDIRTIFCKIFWKEEDYIYIWDFLDFANYEDSCDCGLNYKIIFVIKEWEWCFSFPLSKLTDINIYNLFNEFKKDIFSLWLIKLKW